MGYFVGADGSYHEGDALPGDVAVPQRPSAIDDWANGMWSPNLAKAQAQIVAAIDAKVDALFAVGIPYAGKQLQLDDRSQGRITAAGASAKLALLANPATPWSIQWIMLDNTLMTLTAQQMSDVADAAMEQVSAWVLNARVHKNAVLALTDGAAVLTYDFSTGW